MTKTGMNQTDRSRRGLTALLALTFAAVGFAPALARADTLFVSGGNNEFGSLDVTTGVFTQIGTFSLTGGAIMVAMGSTGPGALVGFDGLGEAYTINTANATTTDLGNSGTAPIGGGGNGSPIQYVYDNNVSTLFARNFNTMTTTPIGTYAFSGDGLVAVGPDGSVYVASFDTTGGGAADELFKINPTTGSATDLGSTGQFSLLAGAFVGGALYAFDAFGDIITLDTTTGAGTVVGTYALPGGDAIFAAGLVASVPEPSSVALLGLGVAGAVAMIARRRAARPEGAAS